VSKQARKKERLRMERRKKERKKGGAGEGGEPIIVANVNAAPGHASRARRGTSTGTGDHGRRVRNFTEAPGSAH
jgi:hypothetical protein